MGGLGIRQANYIADSGQWLGTPVASAGNNYMKIVVITDLHANRPALQAVLTAIRTYILLEMRLGGVAK